MTTLVERFQIGIRRYGYDSDFRRQVEIIVDSEAVSAAELQKCFKDFGV